MRLRRSSPVLRRSGLSVLAMVALAPGVARSAVSSLQTATPAQVRSVQHSPPSRGAGAATFPSIQTYPHAGPVSQPRRIPGTSGAPGFSTHGPWGVFNYGNGEPAGFGPIGLYAVAPWAEDWSGLRNGKPDHDPFDVLKFIPLNNDGSVWLSFSGETRLRNWWEQRPNLGTQKPNDSGRFGVRNLYGADLHIGPHLRFFGQLINADAGGWGGYGYTANYRTRLDVQQAFVEWRQPVLGTQTGFIFGRQQFLDAPSYILYNRETPNVPLSWNGFRLYSVGHRIRFDAYDFVQTNITPAAMFHDTENYATRLYGVNATLAPGQFHLGLEKVRSFLDMFYIGYKLTGSSAAIATRTATASGATTRNNFGMRWYGSAPSFEFSVGALWQGGTFNYARTNLPRPVSAYAINTIIGYRHTPSPVHPFLGVQADLYSGGDARRTNGTVGTYIAPYSPQTNYLDTTTYISPSNLIALSPVIRLTPRNNLTVQFKAPFLWRDSTNDPIYGPSGRYVFRHAFSGGYVGVVPQISLSIQLNRHLTWTQYAARFFTSDSLTRAGGSSGSYYQNNVVFRF